MNNVKLYSYNQGSEGAKNLATSMGIKRLKHEGSRWRPRSGSVVINWGSSRIPDFSDLVLVINDPVRVSESSNKLEFFRKMPEEIVPEWTTDRQIASDWLTEGHTVVCRTKLNGHSGEGIILVSNDSEAIPEAPLYTKYFKKKHEYRVHIVQGEVIDVQQKKRKTDTPDGDVNWKVRNLAGGFIYAREGVVLPDSVRDVALRSFTESGLDFGAVDVIWNEQESKAVVLEINSAPGLSGSTVQNYTDAFKKLLDIP